MSETLKKLVVDIENKTETYIDLTPTEIAEREQQEAEVIQREAERTAELERIANLKESAKAKLLVGEPLTEEEAAVLVI